MFPYDVEIAFVLGLVVFMIGLVEFLSGGTDEEE